MAISQLVAGKLGDQLGRRRMLLGGLIFFGVASLLAIITPTLWLLVLLRIQQAIAGALIFTNGLALTFEAVPISQRARSLGALNAVVVLAEVAGPPVGGLLVIAGGWHAIFWVNLPLVLLALILGWSAVPHDQPRQKGSGWIQFDLAGAGLFAAVLILIVVLLQSVWQPAAMSWLEIMVTLGLALVLVRHEIHQADPFLQPKLFLHRSFASANGVIALSNMAMYVILLGVPLLLANQPRDSVLQPGSLLAAMSASMALFSPFGGRLADRFGRRWPTLTGLAILSLMMLAIAFDGTIRVIWFIFMFLAGAGLGLATAGAQAAVMDSVDKGMTGVASGLTSTSRYLGSIFGTSLLAGLFHPAAGSFESTRMIFLTAGLAALLSVLLSLGIRNCSGG